METSGAGSPLTGGCGELRCGGGHCLPPQKQIVFVRVFSGRVFGKVFAELLTELSDRLI